MFFAPILASYSENEIRGTAHPGPLPRMCFSAMVGMARRAVPARVVAGGTNIQAILAIDGVAPLHAART
jgi:hypothetical protein